MKKIFWIVLFLLPAFSSFAGSGGGSCRELFSITQSRATLNSILIHEINQFSQKNGPISKFSQVIQLSNKVLNRLELDRTENSEHIYAPSSSEAFLLKKIEVYLIRSGVKQILNSTSNSISTPRLWQKIQEFKESNGNSAFQSIFSVLSLEPVYKSIILHTLKMVDDYIIPFTNKEGGASVRFQHFNPDKVPAELLHSIVMDGINKKKIQSLYEIFGNGIYAHYRTTVALKYLSRLTWIIGFMIMLDSLHDLLMQNQVYSFLKDYYSMGPDNLINEMINMDNMIGFDADKSFYLDLSPLELLREYQQHYGH